MGKIRIGGFYIKPLYLGLLIVGLLLVGYGVLLLINSPQFWYDYVYNFRATDLKEVSNAKGASNLEFDLSLAKGQDISGKLVVTMSPAIMFIEVNEQRVVDSGIIEPGNSYSFSLKSNRTYTQYHGSIFFTSDANAEFFCNRDPEISGLKVWSELRASPEFIEPSWLRELMPELGKYEYFKEKFIFKPTKLR